MCSEITEVEWESTKYKGKRPCAGFAHFLHVCLSGTCSDTYHWSFELSKCSLKYEPSLLTKQASLGWDKEKISGWYNLDCQMYIYKLAFIKNIEFWCRFTHIYNHTERYNCVNRHDTDHIKWYARRVGNYSRRSHSREQCPTGKVPGESFHSPHHVSPKYRCNQPDKGQHSWVLTPRGSNLSWSTLGRRWVDVVLVSKH